MLRIPKYDRRDRSRPQVLVLLTCIGLTGYFGYHAISGKHGLQARSRLLERSVTLSQEIEGLKTVRAHINRQIAALSGPSPDPDYISQLASELLGFVAPDEILVVVPKRN